MPNETATAPAATQLPKNSIHNSKGDFQLEPDVEPGKVPTAVLDELRTLRTMQNDAATSFREAVQMQAEKYKVKPKALRRFVVALGRDQVDELNAEAADIERLIEKQAA